MESTVHERHSRKNLALLALGALGVVYGDIGTSPLYAMHQCFAGSSAIEATPANVLGVLSLILWALIIVVTVKYMGFVMRADNNGEGGILALMALAMSRFTEDKRRSRSLILGMGLFGTALLYGDGMITPSISVLSAVEGLEEITPTLKHYVVPITIAILASLFAFQHRGTAWIGTIFGPVLLCWFIVIGALGLNSLLHQPAVLEAINPLYAVKFLVANKWKGFLVLGSVFLAVTGGEALYLDMGHFGRRAIQFGWYGAVLPGLLLNYLGQGAHVLTNPESLSNPFYALVPRSALLPMVILSTTATVIASQAIISGAFSLTRQAVLLGYLPRIPIVHTSSSEIGQIYVPFTNWVLLAATSGLVLVFKSSTALAAAYGVAVTMDMMLTTLLLCVIARKLWGWSWLAAGALTGAFMLFDASFCLSALLKIPHGGWYPLFVALSVCVLMTTWLKGRSILRERLYQRVPTLDDFVNKIVPAEGHLARVPGAAVFMSGNPASTPPVLLHNMKYNRVLHETVAIMTVVVEKTPHVKRSDRINVEDLGRGFYRITAHYGFMESPSIKEILDLAHARGVELRSSNVGFFIGRESILPTDKPGMARWRQRLFAFMARNAQGASPFFELRPNQVVELGVQIQL